MRKLLILLCSVYALPVFGGRYVIQNGAKIQPQLDQLQPGDTLLVRAGTYAESLSLPRSGRLGKPIVFMAYPGERPLILTGQNSISISVSYWVIDGFIFDHENGDSDAFRLRSDADFIIIRNCEIRNGQRDGIDIAAGASDNLIEYNVIHNFFKNGADAHGIVTNPGVLRLQVRNNTIYDCSGDCIQLYASDSDPISSYSKDLVISGNQFYTSLGTASENALDFKGVDGCLVADNEMWGFQNKTVVVQKGCRNLVFDANIIRDGERGIEFRGEGGKTQKNIVFRKNLLYNISDYYAVKFDAVDSVTFVHNTLAMVAPAAIRIEGDGIRGGLFKNNLLYACGKPSIKATFDVDFGYNGWFGTDAGDLAAAGDVSSSDPQFVDLAAGDFALRSGSPAIDRGTDVGLPYAGMAPDLGAFEFGMSPTAVAIGAFYAMPKSDGILLSWRLARASSPSAILLERRSLPDGPFITLAQFTAEREHGEKLFWYLDRDVPEGVYEYRLRFTGGDTAASATVVVQVTPPLQFQLSQNWPNPFSMAAHKATHLLLTLPESRVLTVRVFNLLGQSVQTLLEGRLEAGTHALSWNGKMKNGRSVTPGIYFIEVLSAESKAIRPVLLVE